MHIASLCDTELRIATAGLIAARSGAQIATDIPTSFKPTRVVECSHIGEGGGYRAPHGALSGVPVFLDDSDAPSWVHSVILLDLFTQLLYLL